MAAQHRNTLDNSRGLSVKPGEENISNKWHKKIHEVWSEILNFTDFNPTRTQLFYSSFFFFFACFPLFSFAAVWFRVIKRPYRERNVSVKNTGKLYRAVARDSHHYGRRQSVFGLVRLNQSLAVETQPSQVPLYYSILFKKKVFFLYIYHCSWNYTSTRRDGDLLTG